MYLSRLKIRYISRDVMSGLNRINVKIASSPTAQPAASNGQHGFPPAAAAAAASMHTQAYCAGSGMFLSGAQRYPGKSIYLLNVRS